jgi:hypothetical protein
MRGLGGGVWGGVVAPLASAYVGSVVMLFLHSRFPKRERQPTLRLAAWSALLKDLVRLSVTGYVLFLAIVLVFSFSFADQPRAIRQAITEGGLLAAMGLAGLATLGWVEGVVRRRLGGRRRAERQGPG